MFFRLVTVLGLREIELINLALAHLFTSPSSLGILVAIAGHLRFPLAQLEQRSIGGFLGLERFGQRRGILGGGVQLLLGFLQLRHHRGPLGSRARVLLTLHGFLGLFDRLGRCLAHHFQIFLIIARHGFLGLQSFQSSGFLARRGSRRGRTGASLLTVRRRCLTKCRVPQAGPIRHRSRPSHDLRRRFRRTIQNPGRRSGRYRGPRVSGRFAVRGGLLGVRRAFAMVALQTPGRAHDLLLQFGELGGLTALALSFATATSTTFSLSKGLLKGPHFTKEEVSLVATRLAIRPQIVRPDKPGDQVIGRQPKFLQPHHMLERPLLASWYILAEFDPFGIAVLDADGQAIGGHTKIVPYRALEMELLDG